MADAAVWLPSLVVFGAAAVAFTAGVLGLRRLGRRREAHDAMSARELETSAKARLVGADEAVRDALQEIRFAEAQFGPDAARTLGDTVDRARGWLREAFLLQQRLDDADSATAAARRDWSSRIASLCDAVERALADAETELSVRRAAERHAVDDLPALRDRERRLVARRADAASALERLGSRFSASALAGAQGSLARADHDLAAAATALEEAARRIAEAPGEPVADLLAGAAHALQRSDGELDRVEHVELDLARAVEDAGRDAADLDAELLAARRERDAVADADAGAALAVAIGELSPLLVGREHRADDPFAERDRLRAARDRLEAARATARRAQDRLDGARGALPGAIAIAESQIHVAGEALERARAFAGADARTRLAEAERQLGIALRESDPVAALDAARRAASRASDAEALAHYAALHR